MNTATITFKLLGLHCESCKKISEKRMQKIDGVENAITDLVTGSVVLTSNREISKEELIAALEGTGYTIQEGTL
jgi:copper chaperone CopZ